MPAEEITPVDKAGPGDREREPHRRSGSPPLASAVTFGLGVAALAGVVVTTGPVISEAASVRAVSGSAAAVAALDPAIHHLICYGVITCSGQD